MMARTDRHYRHFMRQITSETLLYTEMVTTGAILHGDRSRLLDFSASEGPLALQLGGDDPAALAECARIGEDWGYDEVNINIGCPSDRVQNGHFGACLMAEPEKVAAGVAAMRAAVKIPVTVKHRIGIDTLDKYEDMERFVRIVAEAGADRFSVHARKAWLQGLSPKENRNVPPLRYAEIHRLKREMPHLDIEINGGITSLDTTMEQLDHVDAVMIGRAAYDNPYLFASADARVFGKTDTDLLSRQTIVERMVPYVTQWCHGDFPLHRVSRHMLMLFSGCPGTRAWKRHLSERPRPADPGKTLLEALEKVPVEVRLSTPDIRCVAA
ncbi:MAG: tRNA-dihydrouridine synthase A [Myxococcota bacterium]|jgi:tRNA-dihydrouridine synthase A